VLVVVGGGAGSFADGVEVVVELPSKCRVSTRDEVERGWRIALATKRSEEAMFGKQDASLKRRPFPGSCLEVNHLYAESALRARDGL